MKSTLLISLLLTQLANASGDDGINTKDIPATSLANSTELQKGTETFDLPPQDLPPLLANLPELLKVKNVAQDSTPPKYAYIYGHHEHLTPDLLKRIIEKGYDALQAIQNDSMDQFDHKLDCFSGDLYKYNDRWFGSGLHWGFGKEWLLKKTYYSTDQTKLLEEFHQTRSAQLETFICIIWALTDHAFSRHEGFTRGSFSIIDLEQKLYRYLEKFACFSASFPELPKPPTPALEDSSTTKPETSDPSLSNTTTGIATEEEKNQIRLDQDRLRESDNDEKNNSETSSETTSEPTLSSSDETAISTISKPSYTSKLDSMISENAKKLPYAVFNIWGSNFTYQRSSSHYKKLSSTQIGVDTRFASDSFALAVLPFRMSHILFGLVQTQGGKIKTFVKFEEAGLGDNRSIASHLFYYSASTTGLNTQDNIRREKDIIPSIAEAGEKLILKLHENEIDLGKRKWINDLVQNYLYQKRPKTYFEESEKIDLYQLYKLSTTFSTFSENQEISDLAKALNKNILDRYKDEKILKYRTGNEVIFHLDTLKKATKD